MMHLYKLLTMILDTLYSWRNIFNNTNI